MNEHERPRRPMTEREGMMWLLGIVVSVCLTCLGVALALR